MAALCAFALVAACGDDGGDTSGSTSLPEPESDLGARFTFSEDPLATSVALGGPEDEDSFEFEVTGPDLVVLTTTSPVTSGDDFVSLALSDAAGAFVQAPVNGFSWEISVGSAALVPGRAGTLTGELHSNLDTVDVDVLLLPTTVPELSDLTSGRWVGLDLSEDRTATVGALEGMWDYDAGTLTLAVEGMRMEGPARIFEHPELGPFLIWATSEPQELIGYMGALFAEDPAICTTNC